MKRLLFTMLCAIAMLSCENDEPVAVIATDPKPASITSPEGGSTLVITEESLPEDITIEWNEADYGANTQITYTVEIDSATKDFSNAATLGITETNSLTISMEELNSKLLSQLHLPANEESTVALRIISAVNEQLPEISELITFKVTTWKSVIAGPPATLWVPGGYQGWNPGAAPVIYANSESEYEGYVYIQEGTGFKFTSSPDWDHINFGDSGEPGVLTTDGAADGLSASESGYYYFKVDIAALTYQMYRVTSFGLIGTATSGGWNSSTAMDFDSETGLFTKTVELSAGALKFRANDSWDHNWGPVDSNLLNGALTQTDAAISITEGGTYTVMLDFTRSQYPYKFSYTVTKDGGSSTLAKLWVPGAYQNWSPGTAPTVYSVNANEYEGYVYMNAGGEFKFTSSGDWDHTNYGDGGAGTLSTDPEAGNLSVAEAGFYRFKINVTALTWEFYKVETFGMIGTATPGSWDSSTPMEFDSETGLWSATLNLVNGALKFRANNSWDLNYGPSDSNSLNGTLMQTDAAISIPDAGNYTVTLDLSRSESPYKYAYTVVKN